MLDGSRPRLRRLALALALASAAGCAREAAHGRRWVRSLTLRGLDRAQLDAAALASRLATEATPWQPWARKRWLDDFVLGGDRSRIEAWLRARGHYDGRVLSVETTPTKRDGVDVTFVIAPGPATTVRSFVVKGADLDDPALRMRRGERFDHDRYLAIKEAWRAALRGRGHAWAAVEGAVVVDADARVADVELTVTPGPTVQIGDVVVEGSTALPPRLVAEHAGVTRGAPFRPALLDEIRGRIYQLELFSRVDVIPEPLDNNSTLARLRLRVHEAPANELRLGVGLGLEAQRQDVHARLSWTRHHLGGGLRRLQVTVEPAYVVTPAVWDPQRHGVALSSDVLFTQLGVPSRLSTILVGVGFDVGVDYAAQYWGPRTQLGFVRSLWRERLHLSIAHRFQSLDFFATDPAILVQPAAGALFGYTDPYRLGWFEEALSLDLRDRPVDARSGLLVAVSAEEGGVYAGGAFTYEKLSPQIRVYLPLGPRLAVAARLEYGHLFSHGAEGTPITRRFYLGGPTSHRGFSYNRLAPQLVRTDGSAETRIPVGGDEMMLASIEARAEVLRGATTALAAVVFLDGGDVVEAGHVDPTRLHWAIGGGIRLKTVVGTIRLDVGGRLTRLAPVELDGRPNPDPGQSVAYHFAFGESF
jgi:translocation and assembly module TamA